MRSNPVRKVIVPIGPSIAYVPLTQGLFALIDSEDASEIGVNNWCAMFGATVKSFYAVRSKVFPDGKRRLLGMHVEILKPRPGYVPDHIYCNTLDNRRSQLREACQSENIFNRNSPRSNNTSGHTGVSQRTKNCWEARIKVKGKTITLGYSKTKGGAIELREKGAKLYFGAFAHAGERDE